MCIAFQADLNKLLTDSSAALSQLLAYLSNPKRKITQLTDAMSELRSKSEDLKNRISFAELAGEKPTRQVEDWLAKVASIDAKISRIQTDHQNGSFRWRINRRARRSLAQVTALSDKLSVLDVVAAKLPPNGVQEVPAEAETSALSMGSYLSQIQDFLRDDEGARIFGIWGMGGVGKSTLLRSINNDLLCSSETGQTSPMFDHIIWAVVSKDYKVEKLQRSVADWLGLRLDEDNEVQKAKQIRDFLKKKNFLLLLDDLWTPVDLAEIGIPQLVRSRPRKQKVVFTTRLEGVCTQMNAGKKIKVECLNEAESWQLFTDKVGEETLQAHVRIPDLARQVSKECDGLPLALVVIGAAMSTKKTPREWLNAITLLQKSRPHEIQGTGDKILPKLKFSYDNLPDEIFRKCFLLCSLWPEDHLISKTDLIECWMGHGLIDERKFDNINEAYDSGHALIGGLQAACLLEAGDNKEREVKMHDVVRDLALWIASDCGEKPDRFVFLSNVIALQQLQGEVERISLLHQDFSNTSDLHINCPKLETLMMRYSFCVKRIMAGFFQGTRALTYLDISYTKIYNLSEEIDLLGNLRYLNISGTSIKSLPVQLGNLYELRFLLLTDLQFIIIPPGVLAKLVMLSVIDMTNTLCKNWKELSMHRGCLKGVGIVLETVGDLHDLAQLPNVQTWRLTLSKLEGFTESLQLLSPSQLGSRNIRFSIQTLQILSCKSLKLVSMETHCNDGIQKWRLSRLEEMKLRKLPELKEIVWRGTSSTEMLSGLTVLTISRCRKLSNISWATRLPSLEDLNVSHCDEMEQIIADGDDEAGFVDDGRAGWAFPSLRKLRLFDMKSLRLFGGSFAFPSLEVILVLCCPRMKKLPFGAEIARAGRKLREIRAEREWWEELDMEKDDKDALLPLLREIGSETMSVPD